MSDDIACRVHQRVGVIHDDLRGEKGANTDGDVTETDADQVTVGGRFGLVQEKHRSHEHVQQEPHQQNDALHYIHAGIEL